jgi:hypothetical protein
MVIVDQKAQVMISFLNTLFMVETQGIGILLNIGAIKIITKFSNK